MSCVVHRVLEIRKAIADRLNWRKGDQALLRHCSDVYALQDSAGVVVTIAKTGRNSLVDRV